MKRLRLAIGDKGSTRVALHVLESPTVGTQYVVTTVRNWGELRRQRDTEARTSSFVRAQRMFAEKRDRLGLVEETPAT